MQQRRNQTKPMTFNDGICNIYSVEHKVIKEKLGNFCFHECSIGVKTKYQLGFIGEKVDRIISIPLNQLPKDARAVAFIKDDGSEDYYTITSFQPSQTFPPSIRINLEKGKVGWAKNEEV